jgi:hypothetical protein
VLELLILAGGQHKARQLQYFIRRETFGYRYAEHSPPFYEDEGWQVGQAYDPHVVLLTWGKLEEINPT